MEASDQATPIRVLIADDHPIVRQGIRVVLDLEPDVEVVAEAGNGLEVLDLARTAAPDVVLMDLVMPEPDGVEATRRITLGCPDIKVIVLTSFGTDAKLFPALEAGAHGFLLKDATPDELVHAIRQVASGQSFLSPPIARRVVRHVAHHDESRARHDVLTVREREVLRVMAEGLSNDEIAKRLCISPATVRTHVSNILFKLHLARRTQAVLYALKHGIANLYQERPSKRSA